MRPNPTFFSGLIASIAIVSGYPAPVSAQEHRGTMEQQMACTQDVFRLCGSQIPDEDRIVACLKRNVRQLSNPCHAVFAADDRQTPPPRDSYQRGFEQRRYDNPPRDRDDNYPAPPPRDDRDDDDPQ